MRAFAGVLVLLAGLTAGASQSLAHPHVFVDVGFGLTSGDNGIAELTVRWEFDAFYSEVVFDELEIDGQGTLNEDQVSVLYEIIFQGLDEYGYYTEVEVDGTVVEPLTPSRFDAEIASGNLVFHFAFPISGLAEADTVRLFGFDTDYFIDYQLNRDHPAIEQELGARAARCVPESERRDVGDWGSADVRGLVCTLETGAG